jgi:hypothetical protein
VLEESLSVLEEGEERNNSVPCNFSFDKRYSFKKKKAISFDLESNHTDHLCNRQERLGIIFFP